MTSLTDLREVVDVVIGVDTHVHTHSAAAVDARTGGVLGEVTVEATADGYAQLVAFADEHAALHAWAIEGTGGHGAGLTRHLSRARASSSSSSTGPNAPGAATAPSPTRWTRSAPPGRHCPGPGSARPRSSGDRQALSVLLAARRSAVEAGTDAQRQLFSLVIAAPEPVRARFRGQKLPAMLRTAAALRVHPPGTPRRPSRSPRCGPWPAGPRPCRRRRPSTRRPSWASCGPGARTCSTSPASARSWPRPCCAPGPTPAGSTPKPPSRCSPAPHPSRPTAARSPPGTASTATATDSSTAPCTPSSCAASATTSHPGLRRPTHHRRQDQPRDQTLPQALHRPRPLPAPRKPRRHRLTIHRSVPSTAWVTTGAGQDAAHHVTGGNLRS